MLNDQLENSFLKWITFAVDEDKKYILVYYELIIFFVSYHVYEYLYELFIIFDILAQQIHSLVIVIRFKYHTESIE